MNELGRWVLIAGVCAVSAGAALADSMLYRAEDGRITFTNVPDNGARPVPGLDQLGAPRASSRPRLPATIYDPFIERLAVEVGLAPALIKAVALTESNLDPHAVSPKGAQGLMQLMPETAREYGVSDAFDPLENLRAGATHLRRQLDAFDGDLTLALAAYNAGAGAVRTAGGVPPFPETIDYVRRIYERLGRAAPPAAGQAARRSASPPARPVRLQRAADGSLSLVN